MAVQVAVKEIGRRVGHVHGRSISTSFSWCQSNVVVESMPLACDRVAVLHVTEPASGTQAEVADVLPLE